MSRYIVLASLDPRNIPSYYIVDTSDNSRVRRYDCQTWAEHKADALNRAESHRTGFNTEGGTDGQEDAKNATQSHTDGERGKI